MALGYHHWHKRIKRKNIQHFLDKLIYVAAITAVGANLPQLLEIWVNHNSSGVSFLSWVTFFVGSLFWIIYGYVHRSLPLIILNSSLALVQAFIVIGILIKP